MEHLPKKIHHNGIGYTLMGDYYIPDLKLPEEKRPIGRWGRMHKAFLQEHRPGQYNALLLSEMCIRDRLYAGKEGDTCEENSSIIMLDTVGRFCAFRLYKR